MAKIVLVVVTVVVLLGAGTLGGLGYVAYQLLGAVQTHSLAEKIEPGKQSVMESFQKAQELVKDRHFVAGDCMAAVLNPDKGAQATEHGPWKALAEQCFPKNAASTENGAEPSTEV